MLTMLMNHYPERLHRVYLVDAPVLFRAFWALISPFVDPVTKEKFQFVTGESRRQAIFGAALDKDQSLPYQRPDGELTDPLDVDRFLHLPIDEAYDEEL
jgi:hypothetical protein